MVRHAPIHRRSSHSDIAICCGRNVFAVHIGGAPLESGHHFESQTIQRIQNVFGRTLRAIWQNEPKQSYESQLQCRSGINAEISRNTCQLSTLILLQPDRCPLGRALFLSRTPRPPPFSSMNSIPAISIAVLIFSAVSSRPPNSPSTDSRRATVGSETPECCARSAWDQPSRARAALT